MRQFLFIASNSFQELIRQPVFLLLMATSSLFIVFLSTVPYFGFGDDPKMVQDMSLAVVLLAGLLMSVLFIDMVNRLDDPVGIKCVDHLNMG